MSMDSLSGVESEPEVYFVSTNADSLSQQIFEQSFKACQEAGIEPQRLPGDECLRLTPKDKNDIYILDDFDSTVCDHLIKHNARVRGAPCVLHCLTNSEDLPGSDHPVYAMCMSGTLITLTGVPTNQRVEVVKKIEWLGGSFTKSLVKSTSHLIAQEVSSKKYQAAMTLGIPVLTLDWLYECYEKSKTSLFDAKDPNLMSKYSCPLFLGCVITSSSLSEKDKIREMVEKGGGKYTGQMAYKECTHLIIEKPEGQKYKTAQKWGSVSIVSPLWIYDCERLGYKVSEEESKYSISKGVSTPEKEHFPLPNLTDISAIHSTTFSTTHIDETMSTTSRSRRSDETIFNPNPANRRGVERPDMDIRCDILTNCKICLRGFDDKTSASLNDIIVNCGGTRSLSTVNAAYIVVLRMDKDTLEHVKSTRQPVVSSDWLKQVYSTQTLVDVDPYLLYKPIKRRLSSTSDDHPQIKRRPVLPSAESTADQSMLDTELVDGNNDEILSQYGGEDTMKNESGQTLKTVETQMTGERASPPADQLRTPGNAVHLPNYADTPINTPFLVKHHQRDLMAPFKDLRFAIDSDIPIEERDSIRLLIGTHGGILIDTDEGTTPLYKVMPLIVNRECEDTADFMVVSTVWVRMCDRMCKYMPVDSNPLFSPITCRDPTVLADCVITTTGLLAHERDAISKLMFASGGRYVEDLRKFSGSGIPATTHLICESTESAKYKAAKNWGIKITKISWIVESINAGLVQPTDPYHPLKESVSKELSTAAVNVRRTLDSLQTPIHSRVQALRGSTSNSSSKKTPTSTKQYLSTSILTDPEQSFHMKLDLDCFDTPENKAKQSKGDETPLDEALDKYLQLALDKHYVKTPDAGGATPHTRTNGQRSTSQAITEGVLSNSIICISKKLASQSEQLSSLVSSLGGQYNPAYSSSATHFIFQGKATEGEYKTAKRNKQHVVCPMWLDKCKEEYQRVPESLYPYNHKVARATHGSNSQSDTPSRRSGRIAPLVIAQEAGDDTQATFKAPAVLNAEVDEESQDGMTDTLRVLKQIKSYMNKRLTIPKKNTNSPTVAGPSSSPSTPVVDAEMNEGEENSRIKGRHVESQSQGGVLVTWDDPTSRFEQERLENGESELDSEVLAEMADDFTQEGTVCQPPASQDLSADYTTGAADDMETSVHEELTPRRFQFSGFSNEERDIMCDKLSPLGAEIIVSSNFDISATHIILNKPQRNEKFLCALVKGLWILEKSYVQACVDANKLLPEEGYEWGNPKASHIDRMNSSVALYAEASYRRRMRVQAGQGSDPFSEWKVALALPKDKLDSMKRILEIGGAEIISSSRLEDIIATATHAFIDVKKSGLSSAEIQSLSKGVVKCLKAEYIPSYLVNDSSFDESKFTFRAISTRPSRSSSHSSRKSFN